jgi:hypothetical protein
MTAASLVSLVADIAAELPDAVAAAQPGAPGAGPAVRTTTWSRKGVAFAMLGLSGIEIRLDPAIAAAATRTPDTAPSPRGSDWVRFNPRELDGHAVDRLRSWLQFAYRRAAGG